MRHGNLLLFGALALGALPACGGGESPGDKTDPDASVKQDGEAPTDLPEAPTGLVGEPGDGKVILRWEASPGVIRYDIERDRGCTGKFEQKVNVGMLTYTDTDVTNGTAYCYVVKAENALGNSEASESVKVFPERAAASADVIVTPSPGQALVQWRRFQDAVGYRVTATPGDIALELSNSTPFTVVSGLADGTEYTFEVIVERQGGAEASVGSASATPGAFRVLQVEADSSNTCALRETGEVLCWGINTANHLGDGFGIGRAVPGLVPNIDDAVEIALGGIHCVRRAGGGVMCWQMRNNDPPTAIAGIDDAVQLAAGSGQTCARRATGAVVCWGYNGMGQLGDGTMIAREEPTPVKGISDAIQVVSGLEHVCALRESGEMSCWGGNTEGQLGDGTTSARSVPTPVKGLVGVVELCAGTRHTCARRPNGEVYCWGSNKFGQLGGSASSTPRTAPQLVAGLADAVELAAGQNHTCARKADGTVACWGEGTYGQIGNSTQSPRTTPAMVNGVSDAVQITAGSFHTCARRANDEILCWGNNGEGQLGDGTMLPQPTPAPVRGVADVAQVAVAPQHTCVRHTSGEVSCWGGNGNGQLGDGTKVSRYTPAKAMGVTGVAQLVAGEGFNCALDTSGTVTCWGGSTPVTGLADVAELASSDAHTCARRKSGDVVCWGRNDQGQLGDGTTTNRTTPTPVKGLSEAIAIAAGSQHTCAQRMGGQVVCWGAGGRIGDGTTTRRADPTPVTGISSPALLRAGGALTCVTDSAGAVSCWGGSDRVVPAPLEGLSKIVELSLGSASCAVRADGGVQCWGSGHGLAISTAPTAYELRSAPSSMLWGGVNVVQVAGTTWHACAVRSDHTLDCWGQNDYGQLARAPLTVPRAVMGL